jgi:hypothetical protein
MDRVQADREARGLDAVRPSDRIEGLDKVVERAAKIEAREESKRRMGGQTSKSAAVLTDDTGVRWAWRVRLILLGAVVAVLAIFGTLMYRFLHPKVNDRYAAELTRQRLREVSQRAQLMKPFDEGETVTLDLVKARLIAKIDEDLAVLRKQLDRDIQNQRHVDLAAIQSRDDLEQLKSLRDGWGQPFELSLPDNDTLRISATAKPGSETLEPLSVRIRAGAPPDR